MGPEDVAREKIDQMLKDSGWIIQDYEDLDLSVGYGVAIREYPFSKEASDYALFVNKVPVGVVEAKPEGWTLCGVTNQSDKYIENLHQKFPNYSLKPSFSSSNCFFPCKIEYNLCIVEITIDASPIV